MATRKLVSLLLWTLILPLSGCGHKGPNAAVTAADQVFLTACVAPQSTATMAATLAATGCFSTTGAAASALFAYTVNAPLWADGAGKDRYLLLPPGQAATFDSNGVLVPPVGTVVFKEFDVDGVRLETRLLWYSATGTWNGYSYGWNADQSVASLLPDGETATTDGQSWTYPSRANCLTCHNAVAGGLLGVRVAELDRTVTLANNQNVNQLQQMANQNLIVMPTLDANIVWQDPLGDAPLEQRARSYLAANCSYCHRPNGMSGTSTNFMYGTALADMGACNVAPTRGNFGNSSAKIIAPGDANNSMISMRMHSVTDSERMPPIGRTQVDTQGAAVVDAWINSLTGCQ